MAYSSTILSYYIPFGRILQLFFGKKWFAAVGKGLKSCYRRKMLPEKRRRRNPWLRIGGNWRHTGDLAACSHPAGEKMILRLGKIAKRMGDDAMQERNRRRLYQRWVLASALALALALGNGWDARPGVHASAESDRILIPGGKTVGIAIETEGLVVVGTSDLGMNASPARLAGLNSGDIITEINGVQVRSAEDLKHLLRAGESAAVQVVRGDEARSLTITPAMDPRDGSARIGAWVRSSTAGVGTLTYVDPVTGEFAALGHPIADADTGVTLPVAEGGIYENRIVQINKSEKGLPGEIVGDFLGEESAIGRVELNSDRGVYGQGYSGDRSEFAYPRGLPVAGSEEVRTGPAQLLTTLQDTIAAYDCEIERIEPGGAKGTRNMVVRITDDKLLAATGGIVQGMSGSPIIQDGKLVGAVTHVLVNDPARGYGIFIENMLDAAG